MNKLISLLPVTLPDQAVTIITLVFAALACFLGYRLLKVWIGLAGLLLGAGVGWFVADFFLDNRWIILAVSALVGLLFCFLAFRVYLLGVFLFCGLAAGLLIQLIPVPDGRLWEIVLPAGSVIGGLLAGLISVKLVRPCVILISAAYGGFTLASGVIRLADYQNDLIFLIIGALLLLIGAIVQFVTTHKRKS